MSRPLLPSERQIGMRQDQPQPSFSNARPPTSFPVGGITLAQLRDRIAKSNKPCHPPEPQDTPIANVRRIFFGVLSSAMKTPSSQKGRQWWRRYAPIIIQELPLFAINRLPVADYRFISDCDVLALLEDEMIFPVGMANREATQDYVCRHLTEQLGILDDKLMRLFRQLDHQAKFQQNRYRKLQLVFIFLATVATALGGIQALALSASPADVPLFAFLETIVALSVTFLAALTGREPPLSQWLNNRRKAEQMRREFFRFLLDLPPYQMLNSDTRQMLLQKRVADINRGVYPDEPVENGSLAANGDSLPPSPQTQPGGAA